ncbi:hypothetical protein B0H13DRAFT_1894792 [Mycena leptocephala]|nr:hypothetical protein B0H13DRAFT_1894792 [Mycena leptocephala]
MTVYMATRGSLFLSESDRQPEAVLPALARADFRRRDQGYFASSDPSWGILTRAFNTSGALKVVVRGGKVGPVEMYEFRIYSKIKDLEVHLLRVRVGYGHHKLFCRGHGGMWSRRQYSPRVITVRNVPGRDDCLLFRPRDAQGGYICQGSKGL